MIVVGHDRHESGRRALAVAADLGGRLHADLRVVHVVDAGDYPLSSDADDWESSAAAAVTAEREAVAQTLRSYPGRWTFESLRGDPAARLAAAAADTEAYLIVVGTRGRGHGAALSRLVGGSVSRILLGRTDRPVLVVPPTPDPEARRPAG